MSQGNKWPPRGQQCSLSQCHSGFPVVEKGFLVCLPPVLRSSGRSPGGPDLESGLEAPGLSRYSCYNWDQTTSLPCPSEPTWVFPPRD